jgi:hypothetical protein
MYHCKKIHACALMCTVLPFTALTNTGTVKMVPYCGPILPPKIIIFTNLYRQYVIFRERLCKFYLPVVLEKEVFR